MDCKVASILVLGVVVGLHAESPLQKFSEMSQKREPSPAELVNFLQKNKHNQAKYKSIGIVLELNHAKEYNHALWRKLAGQFFDLSLRFQQCEINSNDESWLEALGPAFKQIARLIIGKMGIHGNISILTDLNKICCDILVVHDENYDQGAWKSILDVIIDTMNQCCKNNEQENIACVQKLVPIIGNAIAQAGGDSGIHGSLEAKINDTTDYVGVSYTA